jgi:hypothetical protein
LRAAGPGGRHVNIVRDDVRFANEAQVIREMDGIVVRIERGQKAAHNVPPSHESEFQNFHADRVIHNDGTLHDFLDTVYSLGADLLGAGAR